MRGSSRYQALLSGERLGDPPGALRILGRRFGSFGRQAVRRPKSDRKAFHSRRRVPGRASVTSADGGWSGSTTPPSLAIAPPVIRSIFGVNGKTLEFLRALCVLRRKSRRQNPVRSQAADAGEPVGGSYRRTTASGYFVSRSPQSTRIATTTIIGIQSGHLGPADPPVSPVGPGEGDRVAKFCRALGNRCPAHRKRKTTTPIIGRVKPDRHPEVARSPEQQAKQQPE